ncbi:MAG: FAD-dependent oxidoreductase [Firmicutes bacterium]|nr:FAD-dependent oxidoreductase [Bacillota bacterium]
MRKSIWSDSISISERPSLSGDIKTDVLIIGGGMCGILCAYFLNQRGIDCVLAEGNRIASGITKNTTAKITSQHGIIYADLIKQYGLEKAKLYLDANQKALLEYEKICRKIDCDFEKRNAYVYSLDNRAKIEDEVKAVNSLGFNATFLEETELPFKIDGAVCFENQAQFNPLKFISEISKNIKIFENTFVYKLAPNKAFTKNGTIKAKSIIVATHFPFLNKHGSYFLKLYQQRSYVSAYKNVPPINGMYLDENIRGLSFRSYKDITLIGGNNHRTGKKSTAWEPINDFAQKHYLSGERMFQWGNQDCMSLDNIPYIGHYSKNTPNLYVATGFNKWGMTSSMVAAMILTDMIEGRENDFAEVFSPQRSILKPQLFINGFESTVNLLTPIPKRCSHLGCALKWNKYEHTWDCPCHGSRFEENGRIIDNPAMKNIKKD